MLAFPTVTPAFTRTMDAAHFNAVANHPTVRAWLGGEDASNDHPLDLTAVIHEPGNLAFATAHGGFVAEALGSGRYDVHSLFLPEGRGKEAAAAQLDAVAYMFAATDATELRTTVPVTNEAARVFAKRAGFERLIMSRVPWSRDTRVEAECCALSIDRWALRSQRTWAAGVWFHDALAAWKTATQSTRPGHDEDVVHDAMAGAVVLLVQAGNPEKAVRLYNVWAQCAHYQPIELLRLRPIVLDIGDAIVEASGGGLEVLLCR